MTTAKKRLTAEDLLALPDDGFHRYELVNGVLREMPPDGGLHGTVLMRTGAVFLTYVDARNLGRVTIGDVGYILRRNPDFVRAPDLAFTSRERLQGPPASGYETVVPDLIVEVISPGDRPGAVQANIEEWLAAGARLVLAVYPRTRSVVAHTSPTERREYTERDTLDAKPVFADFACPVAQLFQSD